jgi:hypothetical protein
MWMVHAHADAIPRLQAQESLRLAAAMAVGSGAMKRADAQRLVRDWRREAEPPGQRKQRRGNFIQQLQAIGIPIITVPPKTKEQ